MTIDVEELRERIQRAREKGTFESQPRGALKHKPVRVARQTTNWGFSLLLNRVYAIPVLGYGVRTLAAIANLPRILANFRAFQASHISDSARFHQAADDLRIQVKHLEAQLKDIQRDSALLRQAVTVLTAKLEGEQVGPANLANTPITKEAIR